jgi:hypothetical protein
MSEWTGEQLCYLDELEAFDAMRTFLETYWERGGRQSDDIAVLLGSLNRDVAPDGLPLDAAQWSDWRRAVDSVRKV